VHVAISLLLLALSEASTLTRAFGRRLLYVWHIFINARVRLTPLVLPVSLHGAQAPLSIPLLQHKTWTWIARQWDCPENGTGRRPAHSLDARRLFLYFTHSPMYRMASSVTSAPIAERLVGHGIWVDAPLLFCTNSDVPLLLTLNVERKNHGFSLWSRIFQTYVILFYVKSTLALNYIILKAIKKCLKIINLWENFQFAPTICVKWPDIYIILTVYENSLLCHAQFRRCQKMPIFFCTGLCRFLHG